MLGYETNPVSYSVFVVSALVLAISGRLNKKVLALVAAVLPVIALLMENHAIGRVEVLLVWIYLVFAIWREAYLIYYYHFVDRFKMLLWVLLVPFLLLMFNFDMGLPAVTMAVPYLIIFLAAGVMTMQTARHRSAEESRKQFEKYQIYQTVVFFVVCILLTVSNLLETLYNKVIYPTGVLLKTLFFKIVAVIVSLIPVADIDLSMDKEGFYEKLSKEESNEIVVEGNAWAEMLAQAAENQEAEDITPLIICLGVILGIILIVVLLGQVAKHSRVEALDVEREDLPEEDEPKKKSKRSFFEPEKVVRQQYREFMKKAENNEHALVRSDTTKEIREKYNTRVSSNPEAAEQLTEVYRGVRYGEKTATKADAKVMKKLVNKS